MPLTEKAHAGGFILSLANGQRSLDNITVLSGQNLVGGTVIGRKSTAATSATGAAVAGNTGTGTIGSVTYGKARKNGTYRITIIEPASNAGTFSVEDPDGNVIGNGTVAVAYTGDGPGFTIADATDFVAGDAFTVTVVGATFKYAIYDPTATDGTQFAAGILFDAVDASSADKPGVNVARATEVNVNELTWFSGATATQKADGAAALAALGVITR